MLISPSIVKISEIARLLYLHVTIYC
uniref:Uncharacterized protein n=1 Tax=Rhizophora mucronata TaxID=61149 RepID=A0A2P2PYJ9_RHIMU